MTSPLSLLESADLLGRYCYVELAAFELLGARAPSSSSASVSAFVSGASLAHGWRARLLEDHLPVSVGLPGPEELMRSPGPYLDEAFDLLLGHGPEVSEDEGRDGGFLDRLVLVFYPAMLEAYEARRTIASPAADPPLERTLRRVVGDLSAVLEEGKLLSASSALVSEAPRDGALCERLTRRLSGRSPFGPIRRTPETTTSTPQTPGPDRLGGTAPEATGRSPEGGA